VTTADQIEHVLRSAPVQRIRFRCGRTWVDGAQYLAIADGVHAGNIRVSETVADEDAAAAYSFTTTDTFEADTFYLGPSFDFSSVLKLGLLVHEATHAIEDYQRLGLNVIDGECAAYVAQAAYFIARGTTWADKVRVARAAEHRTGRPEMDTLIEAAHATATRILANPRECTVTDAELAALRPAISALPPYADRVDECCGFDGIAVRGR